MIEFLLILTTLTTVIFFVLYSIEKQYSKDSQERIRELIGEYFKTAEKYFSLERKLKKAMFRHKDGTFRTYDFIEGNKND